MNNIKNNRIDTNKIIIKINKNSTIYTNLRILYIIGTVTFKFLILNWIPHLMLVHILLAQSHNGSRYK